MRSPVRFHATSVRLFSVNIKTCFSIGDDVVLRTSQTGNLEFKFYRQQEIVTIQILNEFASRCQTPGLARHSRSTVFTVDSANLRVAFRQGIGFARCFIGRPIIDDNNFDRPIGLRKHARNRLAQQRGSVVDRNDRAD